MSRLLLTFACLTSLLVAFFVGRLTVKTNGPMNVSVVQGSVLKESGTGNGLKEGLSSDTTETRRASVKSLISEIGLRFQDGSPFNNASYMKLMGSFGDLSAEEAKVALVEVDNTIKAPRLKIALQGVLFSQMAEEDAPATIAYIEEHLNGHSSLGQSAKASVISSWASKDPEALWDYYRTHGKMDDDLPDGTANDNAMMLTPMFSAMGVKDLDTALGRLESLSIYERSLAIAGLTESSAWEPERRMALLTAADSMDQEAKQQVRSRVVSQWADLDPEAAIEWSVSLPDNERGELLRVASRPLMTRDPSRGAEILVSHAKTEELPDVYANIVNGWARQDPNAAGQWLSKLPQGPELDQARARFSSRVVSHDPESAMAWALVIDDSDSRARAIRHTYQQWSRVDSDAANRALENAGFSAEQFFSP